MPDSGVLPLSRTAPAQAWQSQACTGKVRTGAGMCCSIDDADLGQHHSYRVLAISRRVCCVALAWETLTRD